MPPPHWYTLVIWGVVVVHPRSSELQFKFSILLKLVTLPLGYEVVKLQPYKGLNSWNILSRVLNLHSAQIKNEGDRRISCDTGLEGVRLVTTSKLPFPNRRQLCWTAGSQTFDHGKTNRRSVNYNY